jgi:serine phosphatase RsbU (regulator of sigma subunit)
VFDEFQRMLLPTVAADLPVVSAHRPGDERLLLGGDFIDCVRLADASVGFVVGDVSGHGPTPAGVAVGLRLAWRGLALSGASAETILPVMQRMLISDASVPDLFATACCGTLLPGGRLCFASAGHPAPLLLDVPPHEAELTVGPPLGVTDGGRWTTTTVTLPPGGALIYTDGLTEGRAAPGASGRMGLDGLIELTNELHLAQYPHRLADVIELASQRGGGLGDDAAALLLAPLAR